ncbi:helix-turn-helix transcriptional regulator [Ruminococcus sp. NK3A76]|uniref:helix-turn-helix domain-containing protein n=1 Tax=Ruminococcus sp. NK3A76 TaxID=877411 RepID=UPI00048B48BC|nr:helix-turn-helix transcriptional regulator [Ruminococcus sp. NK3A76]
MIIFKIDILKALKENGYNTTYLRKNKILSESTIQKIRNKDTSLTLKNLDVICSMLEMQPGDVVEFIKTE